MLNSNFKRELEKDRLGTTRKPVNRSLENQFNTAFTNPSAELAPAELPSHNNGDPRDNPKINPLGLSSVPESYLQAMMSLQKRCTQLQQQADKARQISQKARADNQQLKIKVLEAEEQKLNYETQINNLLKEYNVLNDVLTQTKIQGMLLQKQIQQLKFEKQNVLEKVTEKVCKERAISVLEKKTAQYGRNSSVRNRQQKQDTLPPSASSSYIRSKPPATNLQKSIQREQENVTPSKRDSNLRKSAIKVKDHAESNTIIKQLDRPLPQDKGESTFRVIQEQKPLFSDVKFRRGTGSSMNSLLSGHRYELLEESMSSHPRMPSGGESYINLVKDIMRNQKLLVELNHQLECYQKQLVEGTDKKHMVLAKIEVINNQISKVKQQLKECRDKQASY